WQRLELVRGLMDSDGTISPDGKRCEFSNADRGLIDVMIELLRGFGYKPAVYHGKARRKLFGQDGRPREASEHWRISWTACRRADVPALAQAGTDALHRERAAVEKPPPPDRRHSFGSERACSLHRSG